MYFTHTVAFVDANVLRLCTQAAEASIPDLPPKPATEAPLATGKEKEIANGDARRGLLVKFLPLPRLIMAAS